MGRSDPARALRVAVRSGNEQKLAALIDWLLRTVPLVWPGDDKAPLVAVSIIRGAADTTSSDGFAFRVDDHHIVRGITSPDEVPQLGIGDRIVRINDGQVLEPRQALKDRVPPESLAVLHVWKRAAMAGARARLARGCMNDALLEVAQSSSEEEVSCRIAERLLRARANVRHADANGLSALHWAAYRGKPALCEVLLQHGAPVEGGGPPAQHTPLQLAVVGGQGAALRSLLVSKADPFAPAAGGRQLIHLAALGPCEDLVEMLLDPSPETGGRQKLDALSEHGWSALFLAAAEDNLAMVKALLALGAPLGQVLRGRQLLHHAAACGSAAVLRWLGRECSGQLPVDMRDPKGRTALMLAVQHSQLGTVEALISLGACPVIDAHRCLGDATVDDEVRLMLGAATQQWKRQRSELLLLAAAGGDVRAMRTLHADQGADLLHADERSYTALHHAANGGHEDAVLYLLQATEGARLATTSTRDLGARADWKPVDLAASEKVRTLLADYLQGNESRSRILLYARRRLAPILQSNAQAAEAGGVLKAFVAAAAEVEV